MDCPRDHFLASLDRCLAQEQFLADFYRRFIESSRDVAIKFRHTSMERQRRMLAESLQACAGAVEGSPESIQRINELAESHDEFHHDIRPELYELWLESLTQTVQTTDPEWSETVDQAWRATLQPVIHRMASRYRR